MFKISFEFEDRELTNLDHVNTLLSSLQLSKLEMEDEEGYLATRMEYGENGGLKKTTYAYGFDRLTLVCDTEETEEDELHNWQVETQAFPKTEVPDSRSFHDLWCDQHPNRTMRCVTKYSFAAVNAFVVLHHEKVEAPES